MQDAPTSLPTTEALPGAHADRARLRGLRGTPPVDREFECRILRDGRRSVLHVAATSHLVSTSFLEALYMSTSNPVLQRLVPTNARSPLWVIGEGLHADLDEVALAFYARRMQRVDLAYRLMEEVAPGTTVAQRWRELGGGEVPAHELRLGPGDRAPHAGPADAEAPPA